MFESKKYFSKKDVAKEFGISESTVNNYMRKGMPFYKIGGKLVRFDCTEVEKWIKEKGR
jgi:excisionase family DNA binding protein